MADDPKIIPSPPPAEPFDVQVQPDPAPAQPFDVPTYPDPAPARPVDVQVYPAPPPGAPVDVQVSPDPGPRKPVDVTTSPDAPPREPFDVPTSPDGPPLKPFQVDTPKDPPPRVPFDVSLSPSGPPLVPFDVPTAQDPPPAAPFDVPTTPDEPPLDKFDVPTYPDGPPAVPFDVGVAFDPPPALPFDVPITYDPPPVLLEGDPSETPTISAIINAVKRFDGVLGSFLAGLEQISPVQISIQGAGALDPSVLAAWFRDYTQAVGPGKVAMFIAQQSELFAMNPTVARVFNPLYFVAMSVPGSMGHVHATLDTQAGLDMRAVAQAKDALIKARVDLVGVPEVSELNLYSPGNTQVDGQELSIDEMVDAAIDGVPHPFMKKVRDGTGIPPAKTFDASSYFNDRDSEGGQMVGLQARSRIGIENLQSREPALAASAFINGIVRVQVGANEDPDGCVYSQTQNPADLVDDDDARVPLCFTDLRKDPVRKAYRSVYFRPLNLSFSKSISPEWSEGQAFGRVDPVVGYQKTSRTYSVSFELHAFAAEDLELMYRKMNWLDSMCYPSYGSDSLMRSGPVIRMRIGDAVSTESGGLTGIIKSLSYDFADSLWELKKGSKVPRSIKVSLEFLALHEGPVGLLNGAFGVLRLPPADSKQSSDPGQFTNFVSNGIASAGQPREGAAPRGAEVTPGMFSRFGEPRRK